jgi:hypothetical protein
MAKSIFPKTVAHRTVCVECGGQPSDEDRAQPYWQQLGLDGRCWDKLNRYPYPEGWRYQDPRFLERSMQDIWDER